MTLRIRATLVALLSLVIAAPVAAQGITATIEGRILDETGLPVGNVAITAANRDTGFERMTTTSEDGRYVLLSLPVEGDYEIRAELAGFAPASREGITLRADQVLVIDFTLRVAVRDTIAVAASGVPLDRTRAVLQQTVDEDLIRALPVPGRGFMPLVSLAAGFTGNPDFPNPHGQAFWTNNVLIDGASHFSKWRSAARSFSSGVPLEAVRQVQVFTALFSAEVGEGLASVTSVTTKAGTNEWHGSALVFARDAKLDAPPVFAPTRPPGNGQHFGASIGGPLIVNRLHLFGAYEGRRSRDRNIVISPAAANAPVPDEEDEHLLFGRVDHQRAGRLFTARYSGEIFRWHHEPGGLTLPASGTRYTTDVRTLQITNGVPLSLHTLNEVQVQFSRYTHRRADLDPTVFVSRAGYSIQGGALGRWGFDANPEDTWEAADTVSHVHGTHSIRVGGGVKYVRARTSSLPYGRGAYFFAGGPEQAVEPYLFSQSLAPAESAAVAEPRSLAFAGFLQTDWAIRSDVRLNLGVRYDVERISNVQGFDVDTDVNNVQPRLGVAWDVNGSGRTVVRGGAGIYTQQHVLYPITRVQLEGPGGAVSLTLSQTSPLFPRYPRTLTDIPPPGLAPRDIYVVDPRFRNPFAIQSAAGVQQSIAGGVLAVDFVYLHGRDLLSLIDANAPASLATTATRTVAEADATRPIPPATSGVRKVITLGNDGRSWYRGLEVKFERTGRQLHVLSAYTASRAEDMLNYELPEDSRNPDAEKARAAADVPHNLVAAFEWMLPGSSPLTAGWFVSGIATYRSSRPYTVTWGDDRNGTTQNDARPGDRNTAETGSYRTIDLAVTKRFRWDETSIDARVQAFNLFNAINYNEYVGERLSPFFGRPISAFPRRRIEFAMIVRF